MNVAAVRKMTRNREATRASLLASIDFQRMTVRCLCGWYMRNVLVGDGKRAFTAHVSRCKRKEST